VDDGGEPLGACSCLFASRRRPGQEPPRPLWRWAAPNGIARLVPLFESANPVAVRLGRALLERLTSPGPPTHSTR
jgi:hypothetical protein